MMKRPLSIIIPTWNNPQFFDPCVRSILSTGVLGGLAEIIVVNNGDQPIAEQYAGIPNFKVLKPAENLGWEGGLKLALENSDSPFVVFQNDDTQIPISCALFYQRLLTRFMDKRVGISSPLTTTASGPQSIFHPASPHLVSEVPYLIFFTVMVRRSALEEVGGIDTQLPGGDDLDLSIRMRKAGYKLVISPDAFLIHHGFKTGTRIHGDGYAGDPNGWNSPAMIERTGRALIQKHGFRTWFELFRSEPTRDVKPMPDLEAELVQGYVIGDKILELGCGGKRTVPGAVGIDRVPPGEMVPHVPDQTSSPDIVADVSQPLPLPELSQDTVIARHILEHCLDTLQTLSNWNKVLKIGGRLIVAVPDEAITDGIPLNAEHVHAFDQKNLANFAKACGFKTVEAKESGNGISMVACFEKTTHMDGQYA